MIQEATDLAYKMAQANLFEDTKEEILERVTIWSKYTDGVENLAAMALSKFVPFEDDPDTRLDDEDIEYIHDFWFPLIPYEFEEEW
jgi:hypothetical protein